METQRYWLGLAAAHLVQQVPLNIVTSFADAILSVADSAVSDMPNAQFRDLATQFVTIWRTKAPELTAKEVAIALTAATHVQRFHQGNESVEIVWTGPEPAQTRFRQTEQVILEVVNSAKKRLTIVSYAVYRIPRIRESLVAAANRSVEICLIVETPNRIEGQGEYDCLRALGEDVASASSVYYWPQGNRPKDDNGKFGILHVKCAVADGDLLFLSSANFTEYAFSINMELGLLVTGGKRPGEVERHFDRLIDNGTLAIV